MRNVLVTMLIALGSSACTIDDRAAARPSVDIVILNGKVATLADSGEAAEAIAIAGSEIVAVGSSADISAWIGPATRVVDAGERRIIPGLIDSHIHFIRQANMPGHAVQRVENARSIAEMLEALASESAYVEEGQMITVFGGFVLSQLAEKRLPTRDELTNALPAHPALVQLGFDGPSVTNDRGMEYFAERNVVPDSNGRFEKGESATLAFRAVQADQNIVERLAGLKRLMWYANSVGLTGIHDQGGTDFPNASAFNTFHDYDAFATCIAQNCLTLRTRIQHVVYDKSEADGLLEQKINNTWQGFGTDLARYWTVGEHIVSFPIDGSVNSSYKSKAAKAAQDGWTHEQHSVSFDENTQHLAAISEVDEIHDINSLRWSLAHAFELGAPGTEHLVAQIQALDMGLKVQNHGYYTVTDQFPLGRSLGGDESGPLYRSLSSAGIPLGAGTDGPLLGPMNPWFSIYYMVTARNALGEVVNGEETVSREDALRFYTMGSAWFAFDDEEVGSIEPGKLADLVILNKDYFTVPEEDIPTIQSEMTIVGGKVVHDLISHDNANQR